MTHVRSVNENLDVDLYDSNGGMWPARYYFGIYSGKPQVKICRGWKAFVRDNLLRVGDVCAFELIRIDKVSFRIVIFRANIDASQRPSCKHGEWRIILHLQRIVIQFKLGFYNRYDNCLHRI